MMGEILAMYALGIVTGALLVFIWSMDRRPVLPPLDVDHEHGRTPL